MDNAINFNKMKNNDSLNLSTSCYSAPPQPTKSSKHIEHVQWISYARVLTMLLVIIGHCTYYKIQTDYGGIDYQRTFVKSCLSEKVFETIVSLIYIFHMPMFAMISGMCFNWTLKKEMSLTNLVSSKSLRLLIPFVFTALFVSIPIKYVVGYWDESTYVFRDIILGQFLLGGNSHLWFLVSLFEVFIISYTIGKINYNKGAIYFCLIFIVALVGKRFESPNWLGLTGAAKLLFFFEIGRYYFDKINRLSIIRGKVLFVHLITFCLMGKLLLSIHITKGGSLLLIPLQFLAVYGCLILIGFSKWLVKNSICSRLITHLDKDSFGLYLFSDPFNYAILAIACPLLGTMIFTDNVTYTLMFFTRFVLTLVVSLMITKLVKNLKI